MVFKVQFLNQQHQHHLGICWKCKFGAHPRSMESETVRTGPIVFVLLALQVVLMHAKVGEPLISDTKYNQFRFSDHFRDKRKIRFKFQNAFLLLIPWLVFIT